MKPLIGIPLAFIASLIIGLFIWKIKIQVDKPVKQEVKTQPIPDTPVFHIQVVCFPNTGEYCIHYTNDNWLTLHDINDAFDISENIGTNNLEYNVVNQTHLASQEECVELAKTLKSYQDCENYNEKMKRKYYKLLQYRKDHPIKEVKNQDDCKCPINIY